MYLVTLMLVLALIALIYIFLTWNFDYWRNRGVIGPRPLPLMGNYPNLYMQKRAVTYDLDDIYREFKKRANFVGIFSSRSPQLLVLNPELVHRVFVTDFKHFHDNEVSLFADEKTDFIFANNPFALAGEQWKQSRTEVSPGLTTNRLKAVYPITNKICKHMRDYIAKQAKMAPKNGIDVRDLCLRFTSEVVTDCVLGLDAASFTEKPTPILDMIKNLFQPPLSLIIYLVLEGIFPFIKHIYKPRFISKPVEKFFTDLMQQAIDVRKSQSEDRMDYLQYMLHLQKKKGISTQRLTAHTMTFLLDGFETTASVLAHCLLLLGRNPEVQKKLRGEILNHVNANNEVDFESLNDLPYLDACIHEAIRIFPPAVLASKLCTEPIELTDKNGLKLKVENNQVVVLPLYSLMHDGDFYPNPEEYQPERFLEENGGVKKYREMGVFLGFADGPRICLGMRFALIQIKAALCSILSNYNLRVNNKTRKDNVIHPTFLIARLEGDIWLDIATIN